MFNVIHTDHPVGGHFTHHTHNCIRRTVFFFFIIRSSRHNSSSLIIKNAYYARLSRNENKIFKHEENYKVDRNILS